MSLFKSPDYTRSQDYSETTVKDGIRIHKVTRVTEYITVVDPDAPGVQQRLDAIIHGRPVEVEAVEAPQADERPNRARALALMGR